MGQHTWPGPSITLFIRIICSTHIIYLYMGIFDTGDFPPIPILWGGGRGRYVLVAVNIWAIYIVKLWRINSKEYTYITRKRDSNIPSSYKHLTHPTSPRYICSRLHYLSVCITADRAGGERLGESNLCKTMECYCPSTSDIYSLILGCFYTVAVKGTCTVKYRKRTRQMSSF